MSQLSKRLKEIEQQGKLKAQDSLKDGLKEAAFKGISKEADKQIDKILPEYVGPPQLPKGWGKLWLDAQNLFQMFQWWLGKHFLPKRKK